MASRQVFLKDLKVEDLKRELKERECETTGKKADLQNRLKEALENEGENPDIFLFEIASHQFIIVANCLQKQIGEYVDGKFEEMENKLVTVEEEFQNKFLEVERKIATLSLESGEQQQVVNTALKSPGSDIDRLSKLELSNHLEISKIRMKPPQFDGKSSWVNYLRQFEATAKANGWSLAEKATARTIALRGDATDILQTLSIDEQEGLPSTCLAPGNAIWSVSSRASDIARLVRLAYSSTPENVMERLAVQGFLDGLRDDETRQALTLARPSKLVNALARALEFEAAKQSCRGQAKVRKMEEDVEEGTCNETEIRRAVEDIRRLLDKRPIRCWNGAKFLHLFLLAYWSSIHETTGQTPASIVMGHELRLPCDLKFGCTPGDDVAGEDYGASDRMKDIYDINANDGSSWEGPYEVVTRINDVVYRIQKLPRGKPRVVHFNRLATFAENNDEQAEARVRYVSPPDSELSFKEFMLLHSNGQKARYGVTREEPRDLFQAPADFCLAHCVAADLRMSRGIALTFKKAFGQLEELRRQRPEVGRVLQITVEPARERENISSLAIPKIASGLDGLDWRVIRSMLEVLFRFTGIEILVCCYNPRRSLNEKTVDCFFYQTSRCKNGPCCRYRHGPEDDGTIRDEMSLRRGQCGENATRMHCQPAGQRCSSPTRHRVPLFSGRITNVVLDEPSVLDASSRDCGDKTNSRSGDGRASRYLNAEAFVNK
ncbi:hypothetical protein NQ318_022745 [Aromia moschata]|uniref:C3H1-type domain-containing protein n=1 Tax=Aromia moschata TaxID=1265417 RepID=A0AAV8YCY8_9CUCU|nr:hypothetical protein NQ318_022745 [Aromia moschata]